MPENDPSVTPSLPEIHGRLREVAGLLRESPALDVIGLLRRKGAVVEYHDPYIPHLHHEYEGWKMDSVDDVMASVRAADAVVIITNHSVYDYEAILGSAQFVFDSRNATGRLGKESDKVERL